MTTDDERPAAVIDCEPCRGTGHLLARDLPDGPWLPRVCPACGGLSAWIERQP